MRQLGKLSEHYDAKRNNSRKQYRHYDIVCYKAWYCGGMVDYNIKCNTKKYGHHTHFRVKCNYHKTKGTEVEYEVLYTFYTI